MRTRRLNRTEHTTGIPLSPKPKGFVVMTPKNVIPSIDDTPFIEEIFEIKSALKLELVSRTEHDAHLLYRTEPYILGSCVDRTKYEGTCYRAANWLYVGETSGFGKVGVTYSYHGNKKGVFLYTLNKNFKQLMGCTGKPLRVLKTKKRSERIIMQLQKNTWHEGIIEEANVRGIMDKLPDMLCDYMDRYMDCFRRSEQTFHANVYLKGLLSHLERKSAEPIALEYIDNPRGPRNLQHFMKDAKWDNEGAAKIYQEGLSERLSEDEGMITVDESGMLKKGEHSVGVAPQYCGSVGKVANSQVGVFVGYSGSKGYGLISTQLFMPEKWFDQDYAQKRRDCAVPDDLTFQTKPQIALDLIHKVEQSGLFKAKWIGMDCLYGNSKEFLEAISDNYWYFADIHKEALAWRVQPTFEVPDYKGRGPRPKKMAATTPAEPVAKMRWPIEQCLNEAKDKLGMDHYEFRSWTAWHRHMLLVFIASAFLLEIRLLVIDKKKVPS